MITLTLNLPKKQEKELKKDLEYIETITKKPKEFHVREALIRYLEDMEDIRDALENKEKEKSYTSEEVKKMLNL